MKKYILTTIALISLLFAMTASHADIWVGSYNGKYQPRSENYKGKITQVQIGYSSVTDSSSGKLISSKHNYVYVSTTNAAADNLQFDFSADDLQNGLALMSAIGKNIDVMLELDSNNKLIVQNIVVK